MKQFLLISIAVLALLSSCQKPTPSISISVSMPEDGLSVSGGTVRVNVTSDGEWRTSADDGIAVNPSSGSRNASVTITVPANTTSGERDVEVRFFSSRNTSVGQTVTIHQKVSSVSVTPKDTTVSASGGTVEVKVTSEGEWKTSADDGVSVSPSSGSGGESVKVIVPANSGDERDVKVIFCSALNSSVAETVTIHQESMSLSVTPKETTVAASGGQVEFTVMADGEWKTLADNGSTVTPSSGSGNGSVKVTVPANTTGADRDVTVQVYSTQNTSLSRSVTIHQKSISISVTPSTGTVSASGGQVEFKVTADGAWRASEESEYGAKVYPSTWSTLGERTVQVTVPENTTGLKREVTVKFWLKENTSIFRTVTISQESIAITVSPQTAEVSASGGAFDVTVTSDGAWKISVGDWTDSKGNKITTTDKVNLSSSTGSGNAPVKVGVPANATGQERYVKVEFCSTLNSSICKTVTIHQKALSISVTPDTFDEEFSGERSFNVTVKSDGRWCAHSSENYVTITPYSGSGGESVWITVPENVTKEDRDVKIWFYLESHTTVFDIVIIHQRYPSPGDQG